MTDCHIVLYKKSNSIDVLHTMEMDKYKIIIEEHHIAVLTPKKDGKKIKLAFDIMLHLLLHFFLNSNHCALPL